MAGIRVTPIDVRAIYDPGQADLYPLINMAHEFVEARLSGHNVAEALLTQIEALVTLDIATGGRPQVRSESRGRASVTYESSTGTDGRTKWWRLACQLDPTGRLAQSGKAAANFWVF